MRGRSVSRLAAVTVWLLLAGDALAQFGGPKDTSAVLTGTVVDAMTGEPLARVQVHAWGNGFPGGDAWTDARGRFSITGLQPTGYSAAAMRPGFLRKQAAGVAVKAGEAPRELRMELTPSGAIAGRVLDDAGNPMEHAHVVVVGIAYTSGSLTDSPSEAQGSFRISGLAPGKYRVRAEVQENGPPETRTDGTKEAHFAPTYYGGTLQVTGSRRVEVRPGEDTGGIDIRLMRAPMVTISGHMNGFPAGTGPLWPTLRAIGPERVGWTAGGSAGGVVGGMAVLPDGSFHFWRVSPGRYSLEATSGSRREKSVRVDVEVAGHDIDNVELRYAAPLAIEGRIEYLDEEALWGIYKGPPGRQEQFSDMSGPLTTPPPAQVILRQVEDGLNDYPVYATAKDGRFTIPELPPGRYRTESRGYVQAVVWGGQTMRGNVIDVRPGMGGQTLVIALSSGMATVTGVVRDKTGPVAGTMVHLMPENGDPLAWKSSVQTREDGSYSFTVAPGKYRLVAVDPNDVAARMGLALEEYAATAEWLDLHERDKVRRDLRVETR